MKNVLLALVVSVLLVGCGDKVAVDTWYVAQEVKLNHTESEVLKMGKLIEVKGRIDLMPTYMILMDMLERQREIMSRYQEAPYKATQATIEDAYQLLVAAAVILKTQIGGGDVDADVKGHKGI